MQPPQTLSASRQALLAQRLRARAPARPAVPTRPAGEPPPLSYAQERLWFLDQYAPGSTAYTIPVALRLHGPVDAGALGRALDAVVARHEALRMRFPVTADGRPEVAVAPAGGLPLTVAEAPDEAAARARVEAFLAVPFDLATGPLARALLVRLGPADAVLALALHHIAGDGASVEVLLRETFAGYAGRSLPELPVQYGDYAAWQRGRPGADDDLAYWRRQLAGAEPLDLPTDGPRPPTQTYDGAAHSFAVDPELADRLDRLGRAHGATRYMVLLAAFGALLGRYAGQDDVVVGSPVAGRTAPEVEGLVGCFLNMLTLRVDLAGDPSFADLLHRVRETALDAFAHQELPFERLVSELDLARDVSRSPLFGVLLSVQQYGLTGAAGPSDGTAAGPSNGTANGTADGTADELRWTAFPLERWATRYDLELYVGTGPDGLAGMVVYNTRLFTAGTVARFAEHLTAVLRAVAADPAAPMSTVDLIGPAERRLVVSEWNATETPVPAGGTLPELLRAQAARTPAAVAVRYAGAELTYAELTAAANRIAHTLRGLGVGPGVLVGVHAERSVELVAGLLGVLAAGAGYLPLDPDYPADRLAFVLADAAVPVLLTQRGLATPPAGAATVLALDDPAVWAAAPGTDPAPAAGPDDIAYAIYTSGSTGRPKGVLTTHRAIVNRLHWMQQRYRLAADDAVLQKTPASFDVSVWEFFWPLLTGARLVLARPGGHRDPAYLRELIAAERITTVHFVPSMLDAFLTDLDLSGEARGAGRSIRRVICSGEELPAGTARRAVALLPGELHNLYGPTEAAVDVTAWQCEPAALAGLARVPIGAPIANTHIYLLDRAGRPVPIGLPGELNIGGVQVALGYLGRPGLTADRFRPDPFGPPGSRLYRTGDLARWRPDGTVEFLGRLDSQVKLRGLRIELGEIEATLREQPGVREAAVVVREDRPGDRRLVGYVVGDPPERAALGRTLPEYMVPAAIVELADLPRTPSGKLDRAALPAPASTRDDTAEFVSPATPTERLVAEVWTDVVGVDRVGATDDFFDLGGHSLLATQVVARLRRALPAGQGVSVLDVFLHRTVRALAALADTPAEQRGPRRLLHELTPRRPAPPVLSYVCVPYGGGSAVVYQPLADALPADRALWAVSVPGQDLGVDEDRLSFAELAARCVAEIQERVAGPLALYGHCGMGSALIVEIAQQLEAAGRELTAVYIGAIFPYAKPGNRVGAAVSRVLSLDFLRSDRVLANWMTGMGLKTDEIDEAQLRQIIRNMRRDSDAAEEYFTGLLAAEVPRLRAPVISVVGERDPTTDYYQERYREWHFLTGTAALVVLDEAGHFFLRYRAAEVAEIVTRAHEAVAADDPAALPARADGGTWWGHGLSRSDSRQVVTGPQPSMRRFLGVATGQLASMVCSALTGFAIPVWIYLQTGSLARFALLAVIGLVPGLLVAPLAGAVVDRLNRRRVMLAGDAAAGAIQLGLGLLVWTDQLRVWHIYPLLAALSVALTFQRLAYGSAVPQLVPKRYLGHANGVLQLATGVSQVIVPLVAVGLLAAIGLDGILVLDVVSYTVAVLVTAAIRFPATMAWRRRESLLAEIAEGFRYSWGRRPFRSMLAYFMVLNVFLSPLFLLVTPLVLAFGGLDQVGRVGLVSGLGVFTGGLVMTAWGGPAKARMRGVLLSTVALAGCCLVTGLRPSVPLIAAGAFGMSAAITLLNGIYGTIVLVKVPQRYHGRVFALNTLIAWSTLPLGFGLVAPYGSALFEPLLADGGPLAGSAGRVLGTGPGRGIGLMYVLFAAVIAVLAVVALRTWLARFDDEVPDALPDDLVGLRAVTARTAAPAGTGTPGTTPEARDAAA